MPINFFKHIANPDDDNVIKFTPSDDLKEFVEGYYVFNANYCDGRQLFFNDGYPVVAFMQTKNKKIKINVDGQIKWVGNTWVCGGILKNIYCESSIPFENFFIIRFYPTTFFKFFGIRDDYFEKTQVFDFSEIAGNGFEMFNDAYYHTSSLEKRIQVINSFFSEKIGFYSYPKILIDILDYIDKQDTLTVKDLLEAYTVRLNYKWLERNFKKHLGISPKNYLLIRRFLNAYLDLHSFRSKDLLQIAINNGYYDDNHFIKDFRRFSGVPPKTYFQNIAALPRCCNCGDILPAVNGPVYTNSRRDY